MTDIPEDVMERALEAIASVGIGTTKATMILATAVASALMEERRLAQRELLAEIRAAAIRGQP